MWGVWNSQAPLRFLIMARKYKQNRDHTGEAPEGLRKVTLLVPNDIYLVYRQIGNELGMSADDIMWNVIVNKVKRERDAGDTKEPSSTVPANSGVEHDNTETTTHDDEAEEHGSDSLSCKPSSHFRNGNSTMCKDPDRRDSRANTGPVALSNVKANTEDNVSSPKRS